MSDGWGISSEIAVIWMSLDFTDDQSTYAQVMACCRQAISHYLNQCWPDLCRHMASLGLNELNRFIPERMSISRKRHGYACLTELLVCMLIKRHKTLNNYDILLFKHLYPTKYLLSISFLFSLSLSPSAYHYVFRNIYLSTFGSVARVLV